MCRCQSTCIGGDKKRSNPLCLNDLIIRKCNGQNYILQVVDIEISGRELGCEIVGRETGALIAIILRSIATLRLPQRPGRIEPRAKK